MKIGFIGCGNMASAMIGGLIKNNVCTPVEITASAKTEASIHKAKTTFGINVTVDNTEVAKAGEILVLAVKPQYYEEVINEVKAYISENTIIISIAPGKTLSLLTSLFGEGSKVIRTMPNTPALVGEGMTGVCPNENITPQDMEKAMKILSSFGRAKIVKENEMDAVVAVSGSSPAYVFMFIEALADGAVAAGMARQAAYEFAAQAVLGSAKMVLETGLHPGELKDMVCSPGGTTIAAVKSLENNAFRGSIINCMEECVKKCKGM